MIPDDQRKKTHGRTQKLTKYVSSINMELFLVGINKNQIIDMIAGILCFLKW